MSGWLVEIADSNSNKVTITYNNNRITKVTDGAGKEITFEYDGNYLVRIKDPANRVTSFTYYVGSDANQTKYLKTIQYLRILLFYSKSSKKTLLKKNASIRNLR